MKPAKQASSSYVTAVIYIQQQTVTVMDLNRCALSDEQHKHQGVRTGVLELHAVNLQIPAHN